MTIAFHHFYRVCNRLSSIFSVMLFCAGAVQAAQTVELREVVEYPQRSASATALSLNATTISSQIQAKVESIPVRVSESVSQGQLLIELDCADYVLAQKLAVARIKAAQARLSLAVSQKTRTEQLLEKKLTSQDLADTAIAESIAREAELEESQIGQKSAELDVSRCQVRAPFTGIVTARDIAEGQLASVGTSLLTVVETERLELSARIDPRDVALLQQSESIVFEFGQQVPVTILHVGGVVDSQSRNQEVRFTFNADKPLPGTAGKLIWRDPRPYVSPQYIVKRGKDIGIFIARDGKAEFIPLPDATPGRSSVVSLPLNTLIVVQGLGVMQSGDAL